MAYQAFKRVPASRPGGVRQPRHKPFLAPVKGWVSATNLAAAPEGSARVLENWVPTSTGIKMRRGSDKHGTAHATDPLESLMAYIGTGTREMFGAADGDILDLTSPADADVVPTPEVTGQTSDYYAHTNFANSGGNYMHCANGTDPMLVYDGTNFMPVFDTDLYSLNYDAETVAFTAGQTLTGGTSGHTGIIVKVIDAGTTGTLWLRATSGTFQNNETITDGAGGSATADGVRVSLIPAITGVATDTIDQVNVYRNRIWLTDQTMTAYYLPIDAITGAVGDVVLAGVFRKGGNILFTATWSVDAGNGPNDYIVFATTEGEYAIYQGDPADAATWGIVGLYDASPPMGKNAYLRVGGDLLVLTEIGLVPMSNIKNKDPAALALASISRNIQPDWQSEAQLRRTLPWEIVKWTSRNIAYITCPVTGEESVTPPICFAVNLETGAWSKVTGWNTRCMILHDDGVYFGTNDGALVQADIGGSDQGELIYYTYVGQMDHLGAVGAYKTVTQARAIFRTLAEFNPKVSVTTDYSVSLPSYPAAASPASASLWDVGLWDQATWDTGTTYYTVTTKWVSIGRSGFAHAPVILMTSGSTAAPSAELVAFDTLYNPGGMAV
jgi:hypothetical protein